MGAADGEESVIGELLLDLGPLTLCFSVIRRINGCPDTMVGCCTRGVTPAWLTHRTKREVSLNTALILTWSLLCDFDLLYRGAASYSTTFTRTRAGEDSGGDFSPFWLYPSSTNVTIWLWQDSLVGQKSERRHWRWQWMTFWACSSSMGLREGWHWLGRSVAAITAAAVCSHFLLEWRISCATLATGQLLDMASLTCQDICISVYK